MKPWEQALLNLRKKLNSRAFGGTPELIIPPIPITRNKVHGKFVHHLVASTKTVSEFHLRQIRNRLRQAFAISPIDKFSPDALIV